MRVVEFTWPHHTGGYGCRQPGDMQGEYVPADVARALLAAVTEALEDGDHAPTCGVHGWGWMPTGGPGECDCWVKRARAAVAAATGG